MGSPLIWAGDNAKNLKDNLEHTNTLQKTGTFAAANNQSSFTNVTGLTLSDLRAANVTVSVFIDATTDLVETFQLLAHYTGAAWSFTMESTNAGVSNYDFDITSGGQVQYKSGNESGFSSATIKWALVGTKV